MPPITVILNGDVLIADKLFVANQGLLIVLVTDSAVLIPMPEADARSLRADIAGGCVQRVEVASPFVLLKKADLQ